MSRSRIRVLFVCLGNICRSPLGEGIFEHHVTRLGRRHEFVIDSAGTGSWHVGETPDPGSVRAAMENGVDISGQRARHLQREDFERFDLIVAMDRSNRDTVRALVELPEHRLVLLRQFDPEAPGADVPDPWGMAHDAFVDVFRIVERCMDGLLAHVDEHFSAKG